jgi:hypothetical protein
MGSLSFCPGFHAEIDLKLFHAEFLDRVEAFLPIASVANVGRSASRVTLSPDVTEVADEMSWALPKVGP